MMPYHNWILLALLAALSWAVTNVIDGTLASSGKISINARLALDSLVSLITLCIVFPLVSSFDVVLVAFGLVAGILTYGFTQFYYHALRSESIASVSLFLQLIPVFSACIGFVIYGERFYLENYIGAIIVLIGALLTSADWESVDHRLTKSIVSLNVLFKYMLPATLIMSVSYGINKGLLRDHTFVDVFFWGRVGTSLCGIVVGLTSSSVKRECQYLVQHGRTIVVVSILGAEVFNIVGLLLLTAAYSSGTLTLVSTLTSAQPFFVIALLLAFGSFFDVTKKIGRKSWSVRSSSVVSAALICLGIYFLAQ